MKNVKVLVSLLAAATLMSINVFAGSPAKENKDWAKEDSVAYQSYVSQKNELFTSIQKTKVYFVKNLNSKALLADGSCDGTTLSQGSFYGYEKDGYVYFTQDYTPMSDEFVKEGIRYLAIERKISVSDVTRDPRETAYWRMTAKNFDLFYSLEHFVSEATVIRDNMELQNLVTKIVSDITQINGENNQQKVRNYTLEAYNQPRARR